MDGQAQPARDVPCPFELCPPLAGEPQESILWQGWGVLINKDIKESPHPGVCWGALEDSGVLRQTGGWVGSAPQDELQGPSAVPARSCQAPISLSLWVSMNTSSQVCCLSGGPGSAPV